MTPIIAGRFEQEEQADRAADALRQQGFAIEDVTVFYLNPPGQHATFPVGGDHDKSHGATHAHSGALKGAAIPGALAANPTLTIVAQAIKTVEKALGVTIPL